MKVSTFKSRNQFDLMSISFIKTIRVESRQKVLKNKILRRLFGSKRDVNEDWLKFLDEGLHNVYQFVTQSNNVYATIRFNAGFTRALLKSQS